MNQFRILREDRLGCFYLAWVDVYMKWFTESIYKVGFASIRTGGVRLRII